MACSAIVALLLGTAVGVGSGALQHDALLGASTRCGRTRVSGWIAEPSAAPEAQAEEPGRTEIPARPPTVRRTVPLVHRARGHAGGRAREGSLSSRARPATREPGRAPELLDEPALALGRAGVARSRVAACVARAGVEACVAVDLARVRPRVSPAVDVEALARAEAPVFETELGARPTARASARTNVTGIASVRRGARAGSGKQEDECGSHAAQRAHAPARSQVRVAGGGP